jgi:phage terminase large subunit-like protein
MHVVTQYAVDAVTGKRIVGESERLACLRHLKDLIRAGQVPKGVRVKIRAKHDPKFQWRFDEVKANRIIKFFTYLNHVEGLFAGQPIQLIEAHEFDLGSIFGWVHKDTGMRRYRKAYIQEARKNAKTTRLAGVDNYMMVGDGEQSPKVYTAAMDREQARLLYDASKAMAENSLDLSKRLHIRDYKITHRTRGGKMAPLSKETKNKDGLNPSCAVIDEYHAHPTSEIYDVISSAKGQRAQSLLVIITTAGMDTESPCYKEYQYCKDILTGKISGDQASERYFVMIRELDPGDDEHDEKNWVKANPLRCAIPESLAELREQHDEAFSSQDPAKVRTFRVKNLNRWVHGNEDTYMGDYMEKWDQMGVSREAFWELIKGRPSNVGVDLSKKIDLTASGHIFVLPDGRIAVSAMGFMPEDGVKRHEKTDHIPYGDWAKAGWLITTDGNVTDYDRILDHMQEIEKDQNTPVQELCADPWNATQFMNDAQKLNYMTVEIRQTMANLSEATKLFRELASEGKLVHDGSPLLKWCVGNAVQIVDTKENIMLSKKKAGDTRRIDLLAALINALVRIQPLKEAVNYSEYLKSEEFGM